MTGTTPRTERFRGALESYLRDQRGLEETLRRLTSADCSAVAALACQHGLEVVSVDALTAYARDPDVPDAQVELDARAVTGLPVYAAVAGVLDTWDEELRRTGAITGATAAPRVQALLERIDADAAAGWFPERDPAAGLAGVLDRAQAIDRRTREDSGPDSAVDALADDAWQEANERLRTGTFGQVTSYGAAAELLATLLIDRYGAFTVRVPLPPARTLAPHLIAEYALRHLDLLPVVRAEARLAARTVSRPAVGPGRSLT